MSGECASRRILSLARRSGTLLKQLVATGKPVVLLNFRSCYRNEMGEENVNAIMNVWFGGSELQVQYAMCYGDGILAENSP